MAERVDALSPADSWTLRKAVTALAISPQTESLTRTGRLAFNVMIFIAQRSSPDAEGWWSSPVSAIVNGFGSTTRDSQRVKGYIEQMVSTLVRYYPLAAGDAAFGPNAARGEQASLVGVEQVPIVQDGFDGSRSFTLISEARFSRRSGEAWVTWCFPPTVREMLVEPLRWAQLDLQEMAALSRYAAVALYEIAARYKDVPGGLTNRASTDWWMTALRADSKETTREWRKFKSETLKPALAEINQRTSLEVRLVEYKAGRAVAEAQFQVRRRTGERAPEIPDIAAVDRAAAAGIKERDLDALLDEYGQTAVHRGLELLAARRRLPTSRIAQPLAYLKAILKNGPTGELFAEGGPAPSKQARPPDQVVTEAEGDQQRQTQALNARIDAMSPEELEILATEAHARFAARGALTPAHERRWAAKQYTSPLIRVALREALLARGAVQAREDEDATSK